ncbi:MAG: hypothetical protein AAF799_17730 [Myxococcota bacterium]
MKPGVLPKILSASVFGLTLALFSVWWFMIRAPGPAEVCEHILQVTLREASGQGLSPESQQKLVESTRTQCIEHKQDKIQLRGRIKYATYAKCVMAAQDLLTIGRC